MPEGLTKKMLGLPRWAWLLGLSAGVLLGLYLRSRSKDSEAEEDAEAEDTLGEELPLADDYGYTDQSYADDLGGVGGAGLQPVTGAGSGQPITFVINPATGDVDPTTPVVLTPEPVTTDVETAPGSVAAGDVEVGLGTGKNKPPKYNPDKPDKKPRPLDPDLFGPWHTIPGLSKPGQNDRDKPGGGPPDRPHPNDAHKPPQGGTNGQANNGGGRQGSHPTQVAPPQKPHQQGTVATGATASGGRPSTQDKNKGQKRR
jgi:hypothetical protein